MGEFVAALEGLTNKPAPIPEKKVGDFPTGKTLLASQPEPQPPVEQIAGSTDIPPAGATPPLPPDQPLPRPGKRNRWIPVGIVAVLLCLGVVIATIFIVKGFVNRNLVAAQNSTRTGGQPTQLVSQGQPTSTPHAQVKVLWDTSHGPRTSPAGSAFTPEGMYKTLVQVLGKDQFTVTSGDLSNLDSYAVLVISETSGSTPYSDAEVSQIEQFVRTGGHGLLILSDTPDIENLADPLSRKFSIALGELTTDGPSNINSTEKFFSDVNSIQFLNGGGIFQVSAPAQTASTDRNGNTVIAFCSCDSGRVLAIDAMDAAGAPGTLYSCSASQVAPPLLPKSLHELGLLAVLEFIPEHLRPEITILGVQPAVVDYGLELSPQVRLALPQIVEAAREIAATGRAYNTKPEIIKDVAHNSMQELRWQTVADRILGWLDENKL